MNVKLTFKVIRLFVTRNYWKSVQEELQDSKEKRLVKIKINEIDNELMKINIPIRKSIIDSVDKLYIAFSKANPQLCDEEIIKLFPKNLLIEVKK